jgi:polar amino acid transport system permease protein
MLGLTIQQFGFLFTGAWWTIVLSLLGFAGGTILGFPLTLLLISKTALSRWVSSFIVIIVQGIPLPILMFAVYFGAGLTGYDPATLTAAGLSMAVYSAAFLAEIWKGSLRSIPGTQWEAANCLALTKNDVLFLIILPQAVRIATPPTIGFLVQVIKNTSYAIVLAFAELTYSARVVNNTSNEPFVIFTITGAIYFAICFPLSKLGQRLEAASDKYRKASA